MSTSDKNDQTESIAPAVRAFVISNFLFGQESVTVANGDSFLEGGIIDSTGVLELVAFLEQQFSISIADTELVPANLDSVDNAAAFVARKLSAKMQVAG
jgi:acyl carrier protein